MGKGTVIADGQGNEKLYVYENILDGGKVVVPAGTTVNFTYTGSGKATEGDVYAANWNDGATVSGPALTKAQGIVNAGSTTFTVKVVNDTAWVVGQKISIKTNSDSGSGNDNWGDEDNVYAAPVNGGAGYLSSTGK